MRESKTERKKESKTERKKEKKKDRKKDRKNEWREIKERDILKTLHNNNRSEVIHNNDIIISYMLSSNKT